VANESEGSDEWVDQQYQHDRKDDVEKSAFHFTNLISFCVWVIGLLEAISKKSFGPISLLEPRFKSSKYQCIPAGYDPQK
jgi:hypothetical protein